METTKVTVEYLIVGILISLSILFLASTIAPVEMMALLRLLANSPSVLGTSFVVVTFLPISYGLGLVAEYLGLIMYEGQMRKVKEARFPKYIEANMDWIKKSPLLEPYSHKDQVIPAGAGEKTYGEMRFYVLMNNAALYAEIEAHINQARIIRVLTIAELIFVVGFIIHFLTTGVTLLGISGLIFVIALLVLNVRAIQSRFNRYCRAIERSLKVLTLAEVAEKAKK